MKDITEFCLRFLYDHKKWSVFHANNIFPITPVKNYWKMIPNMESENYAMT
jgi:hypothetical protein